MTTLDYLPWVRPASFDDQPCVRDELNDLTYAEFASWVEAAAEQFAELGVGRGSVVAVMLPNRIELLVSIVAAWRLGAAATPINPVFTATEADYQITDANSVLVVNAGPEAPNGGRPTVAVDDLRRVLVGAVPLPTPDSPPEAAPKTALDELGLLIYTSGSTGKPKGVRLNHSNLIAMANMMKEHCDINGSDHCLLVLPLFHVNAICVSFLTPMAVGAQLTILARFHPVEFLKSVEQHKPTFFSAVPAIYAHLVSLPAEVVADTSSIRYAICGAAPAPKELLEATQTRFGFGLVEGYGLTEGTCASTCNPVDGERRLGTVGVALPGQTVAVMNPEGELVPTGERGEVVIQGANVMQGYLNRPEETAETLRDGWLHTGDIGILDADGYLRIVDRIKDMIIRGGENIYPKEIETVISQHPSVLEVAVVGAPHDVLGEVPVAFVAAYPDQQVGEDELLDLCRTHLTKIKVPVAIRFVGELPKNPVGKPDKPGMRELVSASK